MEINFKKIIQKGRFLAKDSKNYILDKREASFIRHNKKIWGKFLSDSDRGDGEILLETTSLASSIISFSYLANLLAKKYSARIIGYKNYNYEKSRTEKYLFLERTIDKIYKSFNTELMISTELVQAQRLEVEKLFNAIYPNLKNKMDVIELRVEGLWIGDLLYDSHLKGYRVPTVNIEDLCFQNSLKKILGYYIFWSDYFNSHNVKSVILTHCCYDVAVVLRHAIQRGIPCYQITAAHLDYLTKKNLWAYTEFYYYPEEFDELTSKEKKIALTTAKERLKRRFSGEVGVDMIYSTKSAYSKRKTNRVLSKSPRIKILIAPHCFFDSPHGRGVHLFCDFFEWLTFLGNISEKTNYDWYIKTHPDILPENKEIIEGFLRKYPKFTLLPSETSHLQLIDEGIDFALTVYGTIGVEYASLGKTVINASMSNPTVRYNFNIQPNSIEEYEKILLDLPNQKLNIDINKVYEYYYKGNIDHTNDWLFDDYDGLLKKIGGYMRQFEPICYEKFINSFSEQKHVRLQRILMNFIESSKFHLRKKDLNIK